MSEVITYLILDRNLIQNAIEIKITGAFGAYCLCKTWQEARAVIRTYTRLAKGGLVVMLFPATNGARSYERRGQQ